MSERTSEHIGARERSKQGGPSKWTSEWPSTSVYIFGCSGPQSMCALCALRFIFILVRDRMGGKFKSLYSFLLLPLTVGQS